MRIYKYELPNSYGTFIIPMCRIQHTMHVEVVANVPYMWVAIDENQPFEHVIRAIHTGDKQ